MEKTTGKKDGSSVSGETDGFPFILKRKVGNRWRGIREGDFRGGKLREQIFLWTFKT